MYVQINIKVNYHIKGYTYLVFGNKMLINAKRGTIRKQSYKNGVVGYWLDSNTFKSIKWIKENLVKIKDEKTPF